MPSGKRGHFGNLRDRPAENARLTLAGVDGAAWPARCPVAHRTLRLYLGHASCLEADLFRQRRDGLMQRVHERSSARFLRAFNAFVDALR